MILKKQAVIFALYTALTLAMSWPVIANITTHVAGQGGDPWQTMWRFEHEWQIKNLANLFGGGEARLVNISVWPWMPLHLAFGQPTAYNIVFLLSFILSGYFMYLLVKYLTKQEAPAFLAGVLYMFLPFHVAHSLGHFGAMQTQWLPLAILLLFKFARKPSVWNTLGLALVIMLQSWSEHHYTLWLGIFVIIIFLFRLLKHPRGVGNDSSGVAERGSETPAHPGGGILVLFFALIFIFALLPWWPMVKLAVQPSNNLSLGIEQTIRFSADLFAYITPPQWHPIWGGVAHELFGKHFTGNVVEATQFLGFLPLLLLLFFGQRIPRRQKLFWFVVAGMFFVISLGPRLHMFGRVLPLPLPYTLVDSLPVFGAVRAVARAGAFVGVTVSVLFGWVLTTQLKRPISAGIVLAVILAEFLFLPVPLQATKLSRAYEIIAGLPGESLIEIPTATNYTVASQSLYASLIHDKEVIGNIALERALPAGVFEEARSLPALRQLLFLRTAHVLGDRKEFFEQDIVETLPDVLKYVDAHAVAVRVDSLSGEQREAVEHFLAEELGWPGEKFDDVVLYRVQPRSTDGVFLARDGRWENVGYDPKRESTFAEVSYQAAITIYNVTTRPVEVELEFEVEAGKVQVLDRSAQAGEHVKVSTVLGGSSKKTLNFDNFLPERAVIRNPKLNSRPARLF